MMLTTLALNDHFNKLKDGKLPFEAKVAEYSEIEKLISNISKDELNHSWDGLNDISDVFIRDMAAESISIVKHTLSILTDLLDLKVDVFKNKRAIFKQLTTIIEINSNLSSNGDVTCAALQCMRLLSDVNAELRKEFLPLIQPCLLQCLKSPIDQPLKLQVLLNLKLLLNSKLCDFKKSSNTWLECLTPCLFDENANVREAAMSAFNVFKTCLTGKEEYFNTLTVNLIPVKYSKILIELIQTDKDWASIWRLMVEILGKRLHSSSVLVNALLAVEEKAFKTSNIETKKEAFICWKSLVLNFALEHSVLASERRVKLITIPLRANNCRHGEIARVKLDVWWFVVRLLRSDVAKFQETVLHPLLKFCFGPFSDAGNSLNGQSMLSNAVSGEAIIRTYPLMREPCLHALTEILSKSACLPIPPSISKDMWLSPLLEPPLVTQADFVQSARMLTQCIGESVLSIGADLDKLPWLLHAWKSLLVLINQGIEEIVNLNVTESNAKDFKCVAMVKDAFRLLVNLVESILTVPEGKPIGHVVLLMIDCMVMGETALPESILNSHTYAVGSFPVMNGTPAMILAMLLFSPAILHSKTSHKRYHAVFSKLLNLGLNGLLPPLPFAKALLKKFESNLNSELFLPHLQPQLQELWVMIVNNLSGVMENHGSLSDGSDTSYDFQCIYGLLIIPISHFLNNDPTRESIKPLLKPWKKMFELFVINAQLVINTKSSVVIEELCKKIVNVLKRANVTSNYMDHFIQFLMIIYNVSFYESYWKDFKSPAGHSFKGENLKLFHCSQQLLIVSFYKITDLMPIAIDNSECLDKHTNIISFLFLLFSTAVRYNFLNFIVEKGTICIDYYLKVLVENPELNANLEKEVVKLLDKFLEFLDKKIFSAKGNLQSNMDSISSLLEKSFQHPSLKILEVTKYYWNGSLGQNCTKKTNIPKSLSDVLDSALKDTSGSQDGMLKLMTSVVKEPYKSPNILRKSNHNDKVSTKGKVLEGKDEDFKVIRTRAKIPILTEHQKEMMKVRRVDIPALYQDLTQDSASQFFSADTPPISTGAPSSMVPDLAEDANLPFFNDNGSPMTGKDAEIKQLSSSLESKAEEVGSETKTLTSQPGQKVDSDDIPLSERLAKEPAFAFPSENSEKTPPLQDVRPRRMKRQSLVDNVPTKESDSNKSEDLNRENDKSVLYVKEKSSITIKQKEGPDSIKDEPLTNNRTKGPNKRVSTSLKCRDVQVAHDVSDSNQPTPKKSTADVVALSKSISPSILEKTSCPETSVEVSDASSVNQKSKEVIAINAAKPSKDEGKLPVVESPASIDKTCVSKKLNSSDVVSSPSSDSTLSSEASGVGSNTSLTSPNLGNMRRKVLKRCLTKGQPEANLLQLKDSAKENEIPSASPDAAVTKRKRGRPRKNVGNIEDVSPSTSSNAERSKRKVVESVSGNPEQIVDQVSSVSLTEDVTVKPECKEVEDIAKKIKLEKDFCSSDKVACVGENVSANIEGESKSKFVGGSPQKKKDSIQENSLDRGKDDKKELVLKQEAVSPRHSTILESPKKNVIPGSPKSKLSLGSPKSKQPMSSPRSKQSPSGYMSSPSLDKWVIVTKRESTEKKEVKKNDEHSSTKVPCNVVPIGKDTKKMVEAEGCNSEDLVDSSQDQNDLLNSSMTRKCSVSLSRMGEIFSNEVAFIPYEGKLLKCNLSPSKDISSKAESEVRKTLLSGSTVSTNLFPSPRSISGRGARLLTLAQGNKERDSIEDRTADSPSKEADSNSSVCNMEGSPLSHKIPEFGNSTPPTKKPRRIRPMPIGNVSPQFRSLEIGCVVSDGDITIHSYSPNASPSGSVIKKRKAAPESGEDSLLPISPSSSSKKARRVSFADPIVSKHVEFCIPESERKFKKLGVNRCLRLPSDYFPSDEVQLHEESNSHSDNSSPESSSETGSNENLTQSEITTVCPESEKSKDSMKMDINEGSTTIQAKELVEKSSLAEKVEKQLAATLPNLENPKAAIGDKSGTDVTQFPSMECSDSEFEKEQSVSADTKEEEDSFAQKDELKSLNKENMDLSEKVLPCVSLEKEISSIEREFRDEVLPIIESEDKDEMEESVSLSHVSNEDCVAAKDDEEGAMDTSDRGGQLRIHTLDSKKEVFPPLRDCAKPINKILSKLTSRSWRDRCKAALDKKGITTIGGLSRLTEEDLEGIPFRVNKWNNLTEELKAYKLLLDEETAEICQNVVPRSTEKQDCNDIMNMKMFREVLSKLSTQEIVKELGYANMSEEVNRELGAIIKSNNCDVTSNLPGLPSKEQDESNKTGPSYDFKEIPESVLCSKLKPLSMLNFLADRSDIKDIAREIPLEKIMSLLKNLSAAAAASKKESLSDDCSIDETIKDIVQCVLSEVTNDKECVGDSVKLLVWFCKRVLSSEEGMEVISSLLNEMDSSCLSEIILKKEDMLQLLENRLSPSKVLTMAINSLSQCDLSTLTSSDLNKLSDVLDKGRTNEEFVDIFTSKMKERLLMNINPAV